MPAVTSVTGPSRPFSIRFLFATRPAIGSALNLNINFLKRVFNIDIETWSECGGTVKIIACIEDPVVFKKILDRLKEKGECQDAGRLRESCGLPQTTLFD